MSAVIVDGMGLAYRSFFAFSKLITTSGLPSGAPYGFFVALRSWKKRFPGASFHVAWDLEATRKKAIYADYKANREEKVSELPVRDIREMLSCCNINQVQCPGEEADDVIASMVSQMDDDRIFVFSNDKDLLQLVKDGRVIVVRPKRGSTPERFFDEEAVKSVFGVEPQHIACFLAFRGDNVDHVPGVSRVPTTLICQLVEKYGTPQDVYMNIGNEKMTDFQRRSFLNAESQVKVNYELTRLNRRLPLDTTVGNENETRLQDLLNKYEIKGVKSKSYIHLFSTASGFSERTSVAVQMPSIFELA